MGQNANGDSALIVVVVHELRDRAFQIPWNIVWDLVDVKFNGPVIPL